MSSGKDEGKKDRVLHTRENVPLIGGPGSVLPFAVESFLSWCLAISCLAIPAYHYVVATVVCPIMGWVRQVTLSQVGTSTSNVGKQQSKTLKCWLPLTTCSRDEMDRCTPTERLHQLASLLKHETKEGANLSDDRLVEVIRSDEICRRLASLALRATSTESDVLPDKSHADLKEQLVRIWPSLLVLPSLGEGYKYDISLIIPAYRERGSDVRLKLQRAYKACRHPKNVQVVLVDAGSCVDLEESVDDLEDNWGELKLIVFTRGGGRGPCLNYGAGAAAGRLYSFCHSDTTLPKDWDLKVIGALSERNHNGTKSRANSCAFSFGIDTSEAGLNGGSYPPGIKAVETTANIRSHLCSLPYGDQVLSIPSAIFNYIGGFPDQCLMEDYELMSLLRRRSALLPQCGVTDRELLIIVDKPAALCSPRRWQTFGVLYVTFMNSKFVNFYASGMTPNDLFTVYYGRPPPNRSTELSPWEKKLVEMFSHT